MKQVSAHDPYAPFRISSYRRYFSGTVVMTIGQQMQKVAVGWEIYERTGSALKLGYVGLVQFVPLILFAIVAGHVADTYNRKKVLSIALGFTALAALCLAWNSFHHGSVNVMFALLFLTGSAKAFQNPARAGIVPRLVPRELFSVAASWNSSGFELSSMAGPAVGGMLIAYFHSAAIIYVLNAVAALTFLVALIGVPFPHIVVEKNPITLRSLSAGMRFVWRQKEVMAAMTLDMFAVLLGGATSLMPVYAKDILRVGPKGLGWLLSAPSVGAFSTAMIQAHRRPYEKAGPTMLAAVVGFGCATIVFGLSKHFWLSLLMLVLLGVCDNISVIVRQTLIQLLTPDEMRGRVSALNGVFIGTSNELGGFESGVVAGFGGPVFSVVSGGIGTLFVVISVARLWPEIRRYGKLDL